MDANVLVLNAGSSSLKFALFRTAPVLAPVVAGAIDRIGRNDAEIKLKIPARLTGPGRPVPAADHAGGLGSVLDEINPFLDAKGLGAAAHRIVHGGPHFFEPQRVTPDLLAELRRLSPFDSEHLPAEIALIEAVSARFTGLPQVVCFDTAFHRDLPRVARLLPLPRRYESAGVRRYGFHGLSYEFLMDELVRLGDPAAQSGRVVLAHLGSGASLAAVRAGKCIDTSMGFTPAAGLVMGTRSGDLDPGLVSYLALTEQMTPREFHELTSRRSGLLGISETSADLRELLAHEAGDVRAAEAVALFCYQAKKWLGSYAAALGGLDTLAFAGGIGENAPLVRARICDGLGFLGLELDPQRNAENAPVISADAGRVKVRVIRTDEELVIARSAARLGNP